MSEESPKGLSKGLPKPVIWGSPDRRDAHGSEMPVIRGLYPDGIAGHMRAIIEADARFSDLKVSERRPGEKYHTPTGSDEIIPEGQSFIRLEGLGYDRLGTFWKLLNERLNNPPQEQHVQTPPERKRKPPTWQEAAQAHADHYIGKLMNPDTPEDELRLDFLQIAAAVRRVIAEEVQPRVHPGLMEVKFRALSGGHANFYIPRLLEGTAVTDDLPHLEEIINSLEQGDLEYPVNTDLLKTKLTQLRTKLSSTPK